jgi:hypothetical protein
MKKLFFLIFALFVYSFTIYGQEWDTTFKVKLSPGGKENTVKIHSVYIPEVPGKKKFDELKYIISIDGKEKAGRMIGYQKIYVKIIDIDKTDDSENLLIYSVTKDNEKPDLPFYEQHLYIFNNIPEIANVFDGNDIITCGDGVIYYNYDIIGSKIKRKCTIENNKFREILDKEYPLEEKKGTVTESFTLYSSPDTNSSVVENTVEGEKVSIIGCNLNEYNPDADEETGYSVIWFKIKTEKGKTGWANRASGRIEGKGIIWAG